MRPRTALAMVSWESLRSLRGRPVASGLFPFSLWQLAQRATKRALPEGGSAARKGARARAARMGFMLGY